VVKPDEREIERLARQIAAWKMGLVKDRRGERLPDDLWRQCIPQAVEALGRSGAVAIAKDALAGKTREEWS
jgi:hypothetical protein